MKPEYIQLKFINFYFKTQNSCYKIPSAVLQCKNLLGIGSQLVLSTTSVINQK